MVKPKKHLGQHFLTDKNIAEKIVRQLSGKYSAIVEVGAGTGVLTSILIDRLGYKLHVVEIDEESVAYLQAHYPALDNNLLHADFLKTDLSQFATNEIAIIGNFPYNISSQIFFHVLDFKHQVAEVVCMIQKEVAQRIAAPPGSKTYGILSVLLQAWYDIEYCFTVNEQVFFPPPKVKSAVIRLKRNKHVSLGCDEDVFQQVVKKAFNQRRKTLRNGLREIVAPALLSDPIFNRRAEQLAVDEFVWITRLISDSRTYSSRID
jgi:16S rRNA (adenine1518-N6/adenine1519-N6)-dimethyltransferase